MCGYDKTRHLEMIETVIDRQNRNCFQIRFGIITIFSALLAIYADKGSIEYVYICIVPAVYGFVMESFYLRVEKCYRDLYEDVRNNILTNYEMAIENYKCNHGLGESFKSPSVFMVYTFLFFIVILLCA